MIMHLGKRKIVSIAAAEGWLAAFADRTSNMGFSSVRLACWAVIRDESGMEQLFGIFVYNEMSGEMGIAEEDNLFIGYFDERAPLVSREEMKARVELVRARVKLVGESKNWQLVNTE